jgi:hypothetical protein
VNYPGNPRFRPRLSAKPLDTSEEMKQSRKLLCNQAVMITEEGTMGGQSREEDNDIIFHQFGICKLDFQVFCSYPEPFIAIFTTAYDRDVVFAWSKDVASKVLSDEAFIHHVEHETAEKSDFRTFNCWGCNILKFEFLKFVKIMHSLKILLGLHCMYNSFLSQKSNSFY